MYFGYYRWYRLSLLLIFVNTGCFQGDAKFFYDEKKYLNYTALKYLKGFANKIKKNSSITFLLEIGIILKLKRYYNQLSPSGYFGQLKNVEGGGELAWYRDLQIWIRYKIMPPIFYDRNSEILCSIGILGNLMKYNFFLSCIQDGPRSSSDIWIIRRVG